MVEAAFDAQPTLTGDALLLRPLAAQDFDGLYAAASDPGIWAGHPVTDRYKRPVFQGYFQALLDSGATLVILDRTSTEMIGCSRYYVAPDMPDSIAIGFTFLTREYWGGATNRALKALMLEHAFASFPEVWFHIAPGNRRSQKATAKLGAEFVHDATLTLADTPSLWKCYRLTRQDWREAAQTISQPR